MSPEPPGHEIGAALPVDGRTQLCADVLRSGHPSRLRLLGHSMYPAIQHGDIVTIEPVASPDHYQVGDILCCTKADRSFVIHRFVGITTRPDGQLLVTRGDNLPLPDAPWRPERVLGRVARIEPRSTGPRGRRLHGRFPLKAAGSIRGWCRLLSVRFVQRIRSIRLVRVLQRCLFNPRIDCHVEHSTFTDVGNLEPLTILTVVAWDGRGRYLGQVGMAQQRPGVPPGPRRWLVNGLRVRVRYHGCGIGRELLRAGLAAVSAAGRGEVYAFVATGNHASLGLFDAEGFVRSAWPDFAASPSAWQDHVVLQKAIP